MQDFLLLFVFLFFLKESIEIFLKIKNKIYYENKINQLEAKQTLGISEDDFQKTLFYSRDKHNFALWQSILTCLAQIMFLAFGGLGLLDSWTFSVAGDHFIVQGLIFFAALGLFSFILSLPFDWYMTFHLEQKHGFNRQTVKGYITDAIKSLLLGGIFTSIILSLILWVMSAFANYWWLLAWGITFGFSLLSLWIFPSILAPLFNKFTKLEDGSLKSKIEALAAKIGFKAADIFVMDASKRSSHGNAYFTGIFKEKRIVLFDTLIKSMSEDEIVAVLAHELGHFKLKHIFYSLVRSFFVTGCIFYLMSLMQSFLPLYAAFGMTEASYHGGLIVFFLWFGTVDFYLSPIGSYLSRKNEFEADHFAKQVLAGGRTLCEALLKLREANHSMPIADPLFSACYHSHPPIIERIRVLDPSFNQKKI